MKANVQYTLTNGLMKGAQRFWLGSVQSARWTNYHFAGAVRWAAWTETSIVLGHCWKLMDSEKLFNPCASLST